MSFIYIGSPYTSSVTGGEPVRFAIRNLTISANDPSFSISGAEIYQNDALTYGDGYYDYLMSDNKIRFKLHDKGFFEVKSVRFYKDYRVLEEKTTRYLEYRYGDQDINYQVHKEVPDSPDDVPSVRLYIAKRTGTI